MEACASPVKLIHVLWSLEYMDPQGISLFNHEKMHFLQLENLIGQFPFSSPTVFNFFFADYDLPMSDADITAASPEPESEEEEEEENMRHGAQPHALAGRRRDVECVADEHTE